jgi:ligand-binding sensor domain-containing protein
MRIITLLITLFAFGITPLQAFSYFSFKKYQVEDGLSHNTVWCAMQDSYGFIWLGTSDGLNCYNGRGNKVYRNVLNDKFSLENNFVQALFEEENHNIWSEPTGDFISTTVNTIVSLILIRRPAMAFLSVVR